MKAVDAKDIAMSKALLESQISADRSDKIEASKDKLKTEEDEINAITDEIEQVSNAIVDTESNEKTDFVNQAIKSSSSTKQKNGKKKSQAIMKTNELGSSTKPTFNYVVIVAIVAISVLVALFIVMFIQHKKEESKQLELENPRIK